MICSHGCNRKPCLINYYKIKSHIYIDIDKFGAQLHHCFFSFFLHHNKGNGYKKCFRSKKALLRYHILSIITNSQNNRKTNYGNGNLPYIKTKKTIDADYYIHIFNNNNTCFDWFTPHDNLFLHFFTLT